MNATEKAAKRAAAKLTAELKQAGADIGNREFVRRLTWLDQS